MQLNKKTKGYLSILARGKKKKIINDLEQQHFNLLNEEGMKIREFQIKKKKSGPFPVNVHPRMGSGLKPTSALCASDRRFRRNHYGLSR